jgi:VWFA-related protein
MNIKRFRILVALVCAAQLALPAGAQEPAQQPPQQPSPAGQQPTPVLHVTTRLVQVNVVVQDKKGNPVGGLTKDDFVILDQGKPQTISIFSEQSNQAPPATSRAAATALPPPNTFTNRLEEQQGVPSSVSVILLDALNTTFQDQARSRQQIVKFLHQIEPQDRVALYALSNRLSILHEFTSDAAPLIAALDRYKGRNSAVLAASEPEEPNTGIRTPFEDFDAVLSQIYQPMGAFYMNQRVAMTLAAFRAIANRLAGLPGRKNLIWVSGSFPIMIGFDQIQAVDAGPLEKHSYDRDLQDAAELLNDANIAVYPVDARGLMPPNINALSARPAFATPRAQRTVGGAIAAINPSHAEIDTMQTLAERTGGLAFYNRNDLNNSIRHAIDDSRINYVLGFYPAETNWNGKFHKIKVEVKRPGLRLRARNGYFATPETVASEKERQALLRDAAVGPLDATGIGISIHAEVPDLPGISTLTAQIGLDVRELQLAEQNDRWSGTIDFLFLQSDDRGKVLTALQESMAVAMRPETYQAAQKDGLNFTKELKILPGATHLRFVVRDRESGAIGSVTIPLTNLFPARKG